MTIYNSLKKYKNKTLNQSDLDCIDKIHATEVEKVKKYLERLEENITKLKKDGSNYENDYKDIISKYPDFFVKDSEYVSEYGYTARCNAIPCKYADEATHIEFKVTDNYSLPSLSYFLYNKVGNNKLRIDGYTTVPVPDIVFDRRRLFYPASEKKPIKFGLNFDSLLVAMKSESKVDISSDILGKILLNNKKIYKKAMIKFIQTASVAKGKINDLTINTDTWLYDEIVALTNLT